jgi:hypothetical protein
MTAISIVVVSPLAPARADEREPPASLIDRALANAGLCPTPPLDGVRAAAQWIPELRLGAVLTRARLPWGSLDETVVYGALSWPLDRSPVGAAIDEARVDRQRTRRREDLVERIAATWHRREQAYRIEDDIDAELTAEEADAELDALTGSAVEDEP